ncbi:precorrin-8X methylmutase [Roseofilum casamattae]|uniref:Precorrin-8X methylmutase n=1 Tax=Roseofilum casamattae BLCC-M143 TaxID=3022442 RepID=A0ABT7C0I1_9CYAN|nr:precorrin-8X methylmutase [Roseofilum casamattae]MDJ1184249.1 precorrin-8X methylmutase [Roseofilum casamattae BLCC-M143]
MFAIKELVRRVGNGITPRMVRHYHEIGLLPQPTRSPSNYRLYEEADVRRLQRIAALKQRGFQLSHIKQMLAAGNGLPEGELLQQLEGQYQTVLQQLVKLRRTAIALEGLLGRDRSCQSQQGQILARLQLLSEETETADSLENWFWHDWDAAVCDHPENFQEALQRLLPALSQCSAIEIDILSHLVLASGDVSLAAFIRMSPDAIAAARGALSQGCNVIGDIAAVVAACDRTRLAHLSCDCLCAIDNPHIESASDAEQAFWRDPFWRERLEDLIDGNIWVIGYAPSVLLEICHLVETQAARPALIIGLPMGFSHAPAAKRRLMQLPIPYITSESNFGGGLLAAIALNRLAASLIEKPDCHCYLKTQIPQDKSNLKNSSN